MSFVAKKPRVRKTDQAVADDPALGPVYINPRISGDPFGVEQRVDPDAPFGGQITLHEGADVFYFAFGQTLPDERWMVALAFRVGGGASDLLAVVVVPTPVEWVEGNGSDRMSWLGKVWTEPLPIADMPDHRITYATLRSVNSTSLALERWARRRLVDLEQARWLPRGAAGDIEPPRGPRPTKRERTLVDLVVKYVRLCDEGDATPVKTLAERERKAYSTVSTYLHEARHKYDLLAAEGQGQRGGRLTQRAHDLLATIRQEQEAAS